MSAKTPQDKPPKKNKAVRKRQFEEVCSLVETSTLGTMKACRQVRISLEGFYGFMEGREKAIERYARAKEAQTDRLVDQIDELESECLQAVESVDDPKIANAIVQAYKLKIDDRKWIASKLKPKRYGERVDLNHTGDITTKMVRLPAKKGEGSDVA